MRIKELALAGPVHTNPFSAILGVEVKVSADVPEGKFQFWSDGKMLKEVDIP